MLIAAGLVISMAGSAFAAQYYKVRQGDTLWEIARRNGTSVYKLKKLNGISANKPLKIGLVLKVSSKPAFHKSAKSSKYISSSKTQTAESGKPTAAASAVSERHNDVVRTALAYRGARYVRGGTGRNGFDCSGFTRYVYAKYGIRLPHSSRAQVSHGVPVSRSQLKPGDLLFFRTRGSRISHVGIYIGDGKFVHASTPRGGVRVDSLSNSYYARRFCAARRVK